MRYAIVCISTAIALGLGIHGSATGEAESEEVPSIEEQLRLTPHPLLECEKKRRRLTCEQLRTKGGFIISTNLRENGRTIQYQLSAFTSARANPDFANGYETRVRDHLREALPIAAEIMGWEAGAPETEEMLQKANVALEELVISLENLDPAESDDPVAQFGLSKTVFANGAFYSNRDDFANSYSLYLDKPGFQKDR